MEAYEDGDKVSDKLYRGMIGLLLYLIDENISMDAMRPPFHPLIYPIDEETESDTRLALTCYFEFDPLVI